MSYVSLTEDDIRSMLGTIGASSIDELFNDIPASIRKNAHFDLPDAQSETALYHDIKKTASMNRMMHSFAGAGAYNHFIPSVVDHLASRSEFYTAYTPYQPEVSQGTLTAIFEFQTILCTLTGMDVTNASMYDGATSLAEAVLMSCRHNGRKRALVSNAVHPLYRKVLQTYAWANSIALSEISFDDGITSHNDLDRKLDDTVSCVVVQNPNFFGVIENIRAIKDIIHDNKVNLIVAVTEPLSLALLKSPGSCGADIVCGEAQGFGNPLGFGGPLLGFLAAKEQFMRKMPGRLVGKSTDMKGKEAYILTLQTREQHIRRERATSNICSNQGLCLLRAVIYLSYYGNRLRELAELNHSRAAYLRNRLLEKGFSCYSDRPYFNEFALRFNNARLLYDRVIENGFVPGLSLGDYYSGFNDCLLFCATEQNTIEEIDSFVHILENIL